MGPQDAYGAPQETYGAPADQEYGAPAPTSYEAPANAPTAYEAAGAAVADMMSGDILATLAPLFPILIAVGAAIVISMIFSPILAGLFGLKFAAFLGFINPVGNFKLSLVNFSPGTGADLSLELRQEHLWTRDSQDKTETVDPDIYSIVMASYAVCSFVCQIGNSSTDLWETTDRTEICTLTLDV